MQVFGFADETRAAGVASRLRAVGFDAYTETPAGSTLVQVRIGCFSGRADAEGLLQDIRQRIAGDALVVPLTPGAGVSVCVSRELGFIPPDDWGIAAQSASSVAFRVGNARYLVYDGGGWRVAQSAADLAADDLAADLGRGAPSGRADGLSVGYRATRSRDLPLVRADFSANVGGGSLLVAAGELLWHSERAAVVQLGPDVFALRLFRP